MRSIWVLILTMLAAQACAGSVQCPPGDAGVGEGGSPSYWCRKGEGWFWYQDPVDAQTPLPAAVKPVDPTPREVRELEALQRRVKEAHAVALMNPTEANMRAYLVVQQEAYERSLRYKDVWQRVVWTTPDLDPTLKNRPTNNLAIQTWDKTQLSLKESWVGSLARTHGLFFFFRGDCPYCHAAAPVLAEFSRRYGIQVYPVSLDGGAMETFPDAVVDRGQARQLGVTTVPALFLVKPGSQEIQPIGYGVLAGSDILDRIWTLTRPESRPEPQNPRNP